MMQAPSQQTQQQQQQAQQPTINNLAWSEVLFDQPRIALGRGATSNVFLCEWKFSRYAIKVMLRSADKKALKRELEILHNLKHERIAMVLGTCDDLPPSEGEIGILMELMTLGDFQQYLEPADKSVAYLNILRIAADIAEGMRFCHSRGLVHRDLKSKNIGITAYHRGKLLDFGLAKFIEADHTSMTQAVGTYQYAAPETLDDEGEGAAVKAATDVYSFGVCLWEAVCRERPWSGLSVAQIITVLLVRGRSLQIPATCQVDEGMRSLVTRCLSRDQAQRPGFDEIHKLIYKMLETEVQRQVEMEDSPPHEFLCPIT